RRGRTAGRAPWPAGLQPFAGRSGKPPSVEGKALAISPGGPENFKVVNAALRGQGSVSIARAPSTAGETKLPAGTIVLDAAAARAAANIAGETGVSWIALGSSPANLEKLQAPRGAPPGSPPATPRRLQAPGAALYKPWAASMDEGWTRWLLEQYGFDPKSLDNKSIRSGKLNEKFDAIILPNVDKETISTGKPR